MNLIASGMLTRLLEFMGQAALVLLPFVVFAVAVHFIEQLVSQRLARRFGWNSVLWTGWLGTPIHELSHALACVLFRHNIDKIALFEPDLETGRLGYVRHSYVRGNWYQEVGNVLIGVAPLIGGSVALVFLLWLFFPNVASQILSVGAEGESNSASAIQHMGNIVQTTLAGVLTLENLASWKFWLFLYLALCVSTHMAPSGSDYEGASRGIVWVMLFFGALCLFAMVAPSAGNTMVQWTRDFLAPVVGLLGLAMVLCIVVTAVVFLFTEVWDRLTGSRPQMR